jgi:hypothetical protein
MPSLRRTCSVVPAWLLAVLTLGTGLPHRQCTCPDGNVKWFCLRFWEEGSCCCDSACCAAGKDAGVPPPSTPCCCCDPVAGAPGLSDPVAGAPGLCGCRHQDQPPGETPAPNRGLRETPCRKTWLPSKVVSDRSPREGDLAKAASDPLSLPAVPADEGLTPEDVCEPVRQVSRPPPLLDRVVLFQRLLL